MEWNTLLLLALVYSCGSVVMRWLRGRQSVKPGWAGVSAFVLAVTGAVALRRPHVAGLIGGAVWGVLFVLPMGLLNLSRRAMLAGNDRGSRMLKLAAAMLHPTDGVPEEYAVSRAGRLMEQGDNDAASVILRRVADGRSSAAGMAQLYLLRAQRRWGEILAWFSSPAHTGALAGDPALTPLFIRSLGETGKIGAMTDFYRQVEPELDARGNDLTLNLCRLHILAFAGRSQSVRLLLDRSFTRLSSEAKSHWLTTADQAAGRALSDADREVIGRIEAELSNATAGRPWRATATYALIGINFVVFGIELCRGAMKDDEILYRMGGLDLQGIRRHQWWRLFTANFLHYGWEHILMNMLGLWILGPFVEYAIGWVRYVVLYLAAGIGAMLVVLILQSRGLIVQSWVVGASGAIMGLIGANIAILLREWLRFRGQRIRRQLMNVVWIVILQVVFDAFSPHVSSSAHLGGVVVGFIIGIALHYRSDGKLA